MGIIDDVVVNAKSAAETVGKAAGMLVDVSKLKLNLSELNGEIAKRKRLLGEFVYENCHDSAMGNTEVAGKIAEIDELVGRAHSINKMLLEKQNKAVCPVCGKTSLNSAYFCSVCGAKLKDETEEADKAEEPSVTPAEAASAEPASAEPEAAEPEGNESAQNTEETKE